MTTSSEIWGFVAERRLIDDEAGALLADRGALGPNAGGVRRALLDARARALVARSRWKVVELRESATGTPPRFPMEAARSGMTLAVTFARDVPGALRVAVALAALGNPRLAREFGFAADARGTWTCPRSLVVGCAERRRTARPAGAAWPGRTSGEGAAPPGTEVG
jgi:hypothetical protein